MDPLFPLGCNSTPAGVPALGGSFLRSTRGWKNLLPRIVPLLTHLWRWGRWAVCVGSGQIERRIRSGFWPFVHLATVDGVLLGGRASLSGVRELLIWWEADVKQVSTWVDEQMPLTVGL